MSAMRNIPALVAVVVFVLTLSAKPVAPRIPAYDAVMQGNVAAEFTTTDYMTRPHLIGDKQFIAGYMLSGFTGGGAACSFKAGRVNLFGAYAQAAASRHMIRLGLGLDDVFGAGVTYELDRQKTDNESTEITTREVPDGIGAFGSVNFGVMNLWADFSTYRYPSAYVLTDAPATDTEVSERQTEVSVGIMKDSEGERDIAVGGHVDFSYNKQLSQMQSLGLRTTTENNRRATVVGMAYLGVPLFRNRSYSVYVGLAAGGLYSKFVDSLVTAVLVAESYADGAITPNIGFQKTLGKGFEAMCGGSVNILHITRIVSESNLNVDTLTYDVATDNGRFSLGLRWKKGNFAVEGQFSATILTNGPYFISGAGSASTPMMASIGVSLGFGGGAPSATQEAEVVEEEKQVEEPEETEKETEPATSDF
jgi:hypothetical protein